MTAPSMTMTYQPPHYPQNHWSEKDKHDFNVIEAAILKMTAELATFARADDAAYRAVLAGHRQTQMAIVQKYEKPRQP